MFQKFRRLALALILLAAASYADGPIPTSNPAEVVVKGRKVSHSWRGGRIFVPVSDLAPLLNLQTDARDLDLIDSLQSKGGYIWTLTDGRFEARLDPSRYSVAAPRAGAAAPRVGARGSAPAKRETTATGRLIYEVQRFTADTGYVRAYILVTNAGSGTSDPSQMICQFQDGFGKTFAMDKRAVPALGAGESKLFEIFSLVEAKDTSITPTADNVAVNFLSLTNPNANPTSRKEARQQQRQSKVRRGLDFNSGYKDINRSQTLNNRRP